MLFFKSDMKYQKKKKLRLVDWGRVVSYQDVHCTLIIHTLKRLF